MDTKVPEQETPVMTSLKTTKHNQEQNSDSPHKETDILTEANISNKETRGSSKEKSKSSGSLLNDNKARNYQRRKQSRPGRVMSLDNYDEDDETQNYHINSDCSRSQESHTIESLSPTY